MSPFDHTLIALLILGVPLWQHFYGVEAMKKELAEDRPGVRQKVYWHTIVIQWIVTAIVMGYWFFMRRTGNDLGFSLPGGMGFWIGLGVTFIAIAAAMKYQSCKMNTPQKRQAALQELQDRAPFLPRNSPEMRHFSFLAITAGICEEIVYRGYLIWYAMQFTGESGLGLTLAVLLPALFFGLGHLYQGPKGMIQIFFAGLFFGGMYMLTGSLWIPMLIHIYIDLYAGLVTRYLHQSTNKDGAHSKPTEPDATEPDSTSPIAAPGVERGSTPSEAGC